MRTEFHAIWSTSVLVSACAACAQPSFTGLGSLSSISGSLGYGISGDGSTVVGVTAGEAFRWRQDTGMIGLGYGLVPFDDVSVATGVSEDGEIVIGNCIDFDAKQNPSWAFLWTEDEGLRHIGPQPVVGSITGTWARGVSADGNTVVGLTEVISGWYGAYIWRSDEGLSAIPLRRAEGVAGSGDVATGYVTAAPNTEFAAYWSAESGAVSIGDLPGGETAAIAYAASYDGRVVVGGSRSASSIPVYDFEAFRWEKATGMVALGDLPGGFYRSTARAVSADGEIVVGESSTSYDFTFPDEAFIWDALHGMRRLADVLVAEYGIDLQGWTLTSATGLSADARHICGTGRNAEGMFEAWVAHLGASCPADFNRDTHINSQDFFDFLIAFFTADPSADMNSDKIVNSADFFAYLAAFFAGCD